MEAVQAVLPTAVVQVALPTEVGPSGVYHGGLHGREVLPMEVAQAALPMVEVREEVHGALRDPTVVVRVGLPMEAQEGDRGV